MKTQISIIGCGWLGLPLATKLVEEGYCINGSTTAKEKLSTLQKHDINPFLITLDDTGIHGEYPKFLSRSETVIINIPPGLRSNPTKNHVAEIRHLMHQIEKHSITHVLYISSTSVFEDLEDLPVITAEMAPNATSNSGKQLITIEQMLQANSNFKTTILRFGGLADETRHPGKFLSGKSQLSNPKAPVNLIHKTDCIGIICSILKHNHWNVTLNAAYPLHLNKQDYYTNYCKRKNLELPTFNMSDRSKGKHIESKILVQLLNYSFKVAP